MTLPLGLPGYGGPPVVPETKLMQPEPPHSAPVSSQTVKVKTTNYEEEKRKQRSPLFCNFVVFFALLITLSQRQYISELIDTDPIVE